MEISKLKDQGIIIKTKSANLVIDCQDASEKIGSEAAKADFGLSTTPLLKTQRIDVDKRLFSFPGEYEVKGVAVHSHHIAPVTLEKTTPLLFVIYIENFKICYLPVLTNELHSDLIEKIGDIDLLIFTVAGDEKILLSTIEEIEPKSLLALKSAENPHAAELFVQKMGLVVKQEPERVSFKTKSDLSSEKMLAFILE